MCLKIGGKERFEGWSNVLFGCNIEPIIILVIQKQKYCFPRLQVSNNSLQESVLSFHMWAPGG